MTETTEQRSIAAALSFTLAVEKMDGKEMEGFFAPDVVQVEMPNAY